MLRPRKRPRRSEATRAGNHLKYVGLEERYEQHRDGDQLTDVLKPVHKKNGDARASPYGNKRLDGKKRTPRRTEPYTKSSIDTPVLARYRWMNVLNSRSTVSSASWMTRTTVYLNADSRIFPAAAARVRRGLTSLLFWQTMSLWQQPGRRAVRSVP